MRTLALALLILAAAGAAEHETATAMLARTDAAVAAAMKQRDAEVLAWYRANPPARRPVAAVGADARPSEALARERALKFNSLIDGADESAKRGDAASLATNLRFMADYKP